MWLKKDTVISMFFITLLKYLVVAVIVDLAFFLNCSIGRFAMPSAINSSFPQPSLFAPKSLSVIKAPASNPYTNSNN